MSPIAIKSELKLKLHDLMYKIFTELVDKMADSNSEIMQAKYSSIEYYKLISIGVFPDYFVNNVRGVFDNRFFNEIDRIDSWFKDNERDCAVGVIPSNDNIEFINRLTAHGFRLGELHCYWIKSLEDYSSSDYPSDNFRDVSPNLEKEYSTTVVRGLGVEEKEEHEVHTIFAEVSCRMPAWNNFLYYENDEPIATCTVGIYDEFAYLSNAIVLPDHRGKRIQQTMVKHRLSYAQSHQVKYAIATTALDTTSARNMQRAGFQLAFVEHNYVKDI